MHVRVELPVASFVLTTEAVDHVPDPATDRLTNPWARVYEQHPHLPVTRMRLSPEKARDKGERLATPSPLCAVSRQGSTDLGPWSALQRAITWSFIRCCLSSSQ